MWFRLITLMRIQIHIFILCGSGNLFNADADPTFHPDADPDQDPSFQRKGQTLAKVLKYARIPYILAFCRHIDTDLVPDPDFYLMRIRMRIQVTKMMRIRIHDNVWE
jgi:hypothetical protein